MLLDRYIGPIPAFFAKVTIIFLGVFTPFLWLDWAGVDTKKYVFLFFASIVLTAAILPAVSFLRRYHVPRSLGIALIFAVLAGTLIGVALMLHTMMSAEIKVLVDKAPTFAAQVTAFAERATQWAAGYGVTIDLKPGAGLFKDTIAPHIQGVLTEASHQVSHLLGTTLQFLLSLLLVLLFAFFFAEDESFLEHASTSAASNAAGEATASRIFTQIMDKIGRGTRGQLLVAVVFGACYGAYLKAIGLDFAVSIGAAAIVLEQIPFVGGITAVLLAILTTVTQFDDPRLPLLLVLGGYLGLTLCTHKFLSPKLMEKFTGVHKVIVLAFLVIGAETWGIMGALLAVPSAIICTVLYNEWHRARDRAQVRLARSPVTERVSAILGPDGVPLRVAVKPLILNSQDLLD